MARNQVLVIGAGIGGIAVAAKLAKAGYAVTVFEKNEIPGGRCGQIEMQGHRFDTGPTLFIMPELYREAFADLGERLEDHLQLQRVDPNYRLHFGDGSQLVLTTELEKMQAQLEAIEPGSFRQYLRYLEEGCRHYGPALDTVVRRDFRSLLDFANPLTIGRLVRMKALQQHYNSISRYFKDERLRFSLIFQNLYMGIHPYRAPAIFSMMQYTEMCDGIWYPAGGMYRITEVLMQIARRHGVRFVFNAPVERILVDGQRASGVVLRDGRQFQADQVIANADLPYVYRQLLPQNGLQPRLEKKKHGCSALVFFWGLARQYPQLEAHNLFLAPDPRAGFDVLFDELGLTEAPSFYVHVPTRLDPSQAPEGHESLVVAVPVPHIKTERPQDWRALTESSRGYILQRFGEIGIPNLEDYLKFEVSFAPPDWQHRYNLTKGSAHGLSHELTQMAALRPKNRHAHYRNLYFVGASTHPGTGVPSVLLSARHVGDRILQEAGQEIEVREQRSGLRDELPLTPNP